MIFNWYFLLILFFLILGEKITINSIYSETATKIWPSQKTWTLSRRSWDQKISYFIAQSALSFSMSRLFFTRVSLRMQKLSSSQKGLLSMRHTSAFGRKLNWCSVVSKIRYLGWYLSLSRACPSEFGNWKGNQFSN